MHECMKKMWLRTLTKRLRLEQGWILSWKSVLSDKRLFGSRDKNFYREREVRKWKSDHASAIYRKTQLDGSRICRALNLDRWESVEVMLKCYWQQKQELDGSKHLLRRCRGDRSLRKTSRWIEKLSRRNPKILMDRESVEDLLTRQRG